MKKAVVLINHVMLCVLGCATGGLKIAGLFTNKVAFEFVLFYKLGFSHSAVVGFGVLQLLGALCLLHRDWIKKGAGLLLVTFVVASAALFFSQNWTFGFFSLLFWGMALLCWRRNFFTRF